MRGVSDMSDTITIRKSELRNTYGDDTKPEYWRWAAESIRKSWPTAAKALEAIAAEMEKR